MGGLLNGIGGLLTPSDEPEIEEPQGPSAMDAAMQAAIEKHAAAVKAGLVTDNQPRVTVARRTNGGAFGRRGA